MSDPSSEYYTEEAVTLNDPDTFDIPLNDDDNNDSGDYRDTTPIVDNAFYNQDNENTDIFDDANDQQVNFTDNIPAPVHYHAVVYNDNYTGDEDKKPQPFRYGIDKFINLDIAPIKYISDHINFTKIKEIKPYLYIAGGTLVFTFALVKVIRR